MCNKDGDPLNSFLLYISVLSIWVRVCVRLCTQYSSIVYSCVHVITLCTDPLRSTDTETRFKQTDV